MIAVTVTAAVKKRIKFNRKSCRRAVFVDISTEAGRQRNALGTDNDSQLGPHSESPGRHTPGMSMRELPESFNRGGNMS